MKEMHNTLKKTRTLPAAVLSAVLLAFLPCCTSLQQDVSISADSSQDGGLSASAALTLAKADAAAIAGDAKAYSAQLSSLISDIENRLSSAQRLDKAAEARLTALAGRAWLLKGNRNNAAKCYERAAAKRANDSQVQILGHRLGKIGDLSALIAQQDDNALLILEQAVDSYRAGSYADAAGQFDTAFLYLDGGYREAYKPLRQDAWQLKDSSGARAGIAELVRKKELTVMEMMQIAQESTDILNAYTASQKLDGTKLFQALLREGLMNSVSNETAPTAATMVNRNDSGVSASTAVTRLLAARFLWNLYWRGGGADPQKYSARYRSRASAKSPVRDLALDSADFDAVMGCVEKEWLDLADGVQFNGSGRISGAAFDSAVRKVD